MIFAHHLKRHVLWLCGKKFCCSKCQRKFKDLKLLNRHIVVNHNSIFDIQEEDANKETTINNEAIETKNDSNVFICQICNKNFNKPKYLLYHLKKHTADFTCPNCLKVGKFKIKNHH